MKKSLIACMTGRRGKAVKRSEEQRAAMLDELRRSEYKYRNLVENINEGIAIVDEHKNAGNFSILDYHLKVQLVGEINSKAIDEPLEFK